MSSITARIRTRLQFLRDTIQGNMEGVLDRNTTVQDSFLEKHKIRLIPHEFDRATDKAIDPPILFAPLPQATIDKHPINEQGCIDPLVGNDLHTFIDYYPEDTTDIYQSRWSPRSCADHVFLYLDKWVFGGFPREKMPPGTSSLADLGGVVGIWAPFEVLVEEDLQGPDWRAEFYEYDIERFKEKLPHVILFSKQSHFGQNGSIIYGELIQLIVAMRGRAYQPKMDIDEDADEEDLIIPENAEFVFKYEQRFPTLMISLVGPQHARIYYACMDGSELIVRQSSLFSFEKRETAPLDYFARFLSSEPLKEDKKDCVN